MKKQAIHQNLNTSFVNVGALVRYLRSLEFVGSIRIELASYEADIVFTSSKTIKAREYDHIAGRISHGQHALQRILIRAKEPHGRIDVYKSTEGYGGLEEGSVFVDRLIVSGAREMAANGGGSSMRLQADGELVLGAQARENSLVLAALSELLRIVDESLALGKLSFSAAFRVACDGVAPEFPFMQKDPGALVYNDGEVVLNADADADVVTAAVFAALRPIFERLRREAKYSELLRISLERLGEASAARRDEFVRLGLMRHIEDLLTPDR